MSEKLEKINKNNIRENNKRVDHNYKFGDKFILTHNDEYKYEMPYYGPTYDTTVLDQWYVHIALC